MSDRDTFKYHLKLGHKVIYRGITNDPIRREAQHREEFPGSRLVQVGRRTTREAAWKWEHEGGKRRYRRGK